MALRDESNCVTGPRSRCVLRTRAPDQAPLRSQGNVEVTAYSRVTGSGGFPAEYCSAFHPGTWSDLPPLMNDGTWAEPAAPDPGDGASHLIVVESR